MTMRRVTGLRLVLLGLIGVGVTQLATPGVARAGGSGCVVCNSVATNISVCACASPQCGGLGICNTQITYDCYYEPSADDYFPTNVRTHPGCSCTMYC